MSETFAFEAQERATNDPTLVVDVDGFEGPLDLLLELARRQKIDLSRISILALAEQYLGFIEAARKLRLELAADYLVMAAWLAYLKSRLLLPEPPKADEPSAEDLAAALAFRLKRLEAMRKAAEALQSRPLLGRDVFARGLTEGIRDTRHGPYEATLYDLLSAYARQRQKAALSHVSLHKREVWTLAQAKELLSRLLGQTVGWASLDAFLLDYMAEPGKAATVKASSFSASLEMAKEGSLDLRQDAPFAPLYIRARSK